jgi:hypothetical protein
MYERHYSSLKDMFKVVFFPTNTFHRGEPRQQGQSCTNDFDSCDGIFHVRSLFMFMRVVSRHYDSCGLSLDHPVDWTCDAICDIG